MRKSKKLSTHLARLITIYLGVITALVLLVFMLSGCTDNCSTTTSYTYYEPVYKTTEEIRQAVAVEGPRELGTPGKIYIYDRFLLINQPNEGIHIIDNSDVKDPKTISFINIPGNFDMAVRDNMLYADSYIDLLTFDISQPDQVELVNRVENAFPLYNTRFGYAPQEGTVITEMKQIDVQEVSHDCMTTSPDIMFLDGNFLAFRTDVSSAMNVSPGPAIGTGGSMARFAIVEDYLYAVDDYDLNVFGLNQPDKPDIKASQNIGWGIETIFPYKGNLFIGSRNGMFIYDLLNPELPEFQSAVSHINTCDPVVVNDDYAFVTLRSENNNDWCGTAFTNQLDVIDITDIANAQLLTTYGMTNPYGLGLDGNTLFITEGEFGLKVFDISDVYDIDNNLLDEIKDYHGYDVIPFNDVLLMIGEDGLYQFDYSDPANLYLLSAIPTYDGL
jgi:hypothetical protein